PAGYIKLLQFTAVREYMKPINEADMTMRNPTPRQVNESFMELKLPDVKTKIMGDVARRVDFLNAA
ncbi:MAG: hypothetical protein V1908_04055, partial [Candidatus Peregrinibacteria bacterium]